jgi:ORF6N domain
MQLQKIETKIYEVRGFKVMLDYDLAELYQVETKVLNQAVKRNSKRFPTDFMFQLTKIELETMRSQIVTAYKETEPMLSQNVTASQKKRNVTALPYAFTEQGLAMLSGILNSDIAIEVNISIMRAFVMMRQVASQYGELYKKIQALESNDKEIFEALNYLLNKDKETTEQKDRKQIGFK